MGFLPDIQRRFIIRAVTLAMVILFTRLAIAQQSVYSSRVDSVLRLMTLEEKIGQLNQLSGKEEVTGPVTGNSNILNDIRTGKVGSLLNVRGAKRTRDLQMLAMQSRLKIPLLFGLDIIHGYRTTLPIPLALSCSWELKLIEQSARLSAVEATASGLHWTFAPMIDVSRDPRWGRVMEGAGEDPFLVSEIGKAWIYGFQGKGLGTDQSLMACAKHFAGYGAAIGGRDYNTADISERSLWEIYLPPFKAAVDAGVATFMNGLHELNGIPVTANEFLQKKILKEKWQFTGFNVSDWASVKEMTAHGYAADNYDASVKALNAGNDMDMEGKCYISNLSKAVAEGEVSIASIDDAVSRILLKKFEMGLFDDPFRYCDEVLELKVMNDPVSRIFAGEAARKSIVLLRNEKNVLPLSSSVKSIALIGPLADSKKDMSGAWNVKWTDTTAVTLYAALKQRSGGGVKLRYEKGCEVEGMSKAGFEKAIKAAKGSDMIILSIGEIKEMSGEAKSKADLSLPGVQEELLKELCALGKPVVVLVNAGRPLLLNSIAANASAILYTWWLGDEAGHAMADVLFGDYNPSAKLTMTFPSSVGQIPVFYNHSNTGRPPSTAKGASNAYKSGYIDLPANPLFPFGYGLSYTSFAYSNISSSDTIFKKEKALTLQFDLTNTGKLAGEEIVQLYIRDRVASVVQPVRALKGFQKLTLAAGETKQVIFTVDEQMLSICNQQMESIVEPGVFDLMIGSSSADIKLKTVIKAVEK